MSQLTLQMPCLPCGPDCIWPPQPLNGILLSMSGFSNFACSDCDFYNQAVLVPFKEVFPTIPPTCFFELFFPAVCQSNVFRISVQASIVPGTAVIIAAITSDLPSTVVSGSRLLTPVEIPTNGPFDMGISVATLQCQFVLPWATVEGLS